MVNNYRLLKKCNFGSTIFKMEEKCGGGIAVKKNYECSSDCEFDIWRCKWINEGDKMKKVADSVYEIKKKAGVFFKINKLGDFFITAAHCLGEEHNKECVENHDIAIYNTVTGIEGNEAWNNFKNQLISGKFYNQLYQVDGGNQSFKPGDSGLLCNVVNSKQIQQYELLDYDGREDGVLLVSGGTTASVLNGLFPKQIKYGSAGSVMDGIWIPRDSTEMVFSGQEGVIKEMFDVKWQEFEKHSKITSILKHPYHILNAEEKIIAGNHHQFPDLVTEKICDIKQVKKVKVPKQNGIECYIFSLNKKIFSFHETENRFIFAILPAFEIDSELPLKSGTPIFNAETNELISCITKSYNNKVYAVSGIGWESGQIEKEKIWIGVKLHYMGLNESVYGSYFGPYSEVKKLATAKALEVFGEKIGLCVYVQEKMVQIVTYDENGKERWRVRLMHEGCRIADSTRNFQEDINNENFGKS